MALRRYLRRALLGLFMFSHSFVLDIYGNPTTLGCQMAIKPELPLEQAKVRFPELQIQAHSSNSLREPV